jgi:hypothetical protein
MTLPGVDAGHPTPETVDRGLVATVVPHVDLLDVRLDWCHASVNCARAEVPNEWASDAQVFVDTHLERHGANAFRAYSFIQLRWDREPVVTDEDEPEVGVSAIYALDYTLSGDQTFDDVALEHFCVFNGTFNAWPYWREFVQSTTQRLGVTPFVMPVMRITSRSQESLRREADEAAQVRASNAEVK